MTFFSSNSYEIVKLFICQFVCAMFGIVTAFATASNTEFPLLMLSSILGIVLFMYLIYDHMWTIGSKDRIRVDAAVCEYDKFKPLKMALIENIPNYIFNIIAAVVTIFLSTNESAGNIGAVCKLIGMALQGMFIGLIQPHEALAVSPYPYLFTPLLMIAVSILAYNLGYNNKLQIYFSKNKKK